MSKIKQNSAITLIALVITIIVLLILAGLTLTLVLGENGLFGKAKKAKEDTNATQAVEDVQLKIIEAQTEGLGNFTWENFLKVLKNSNDTYLVKTTSSQTSSLSSENGGISEVTGLNNHTTGSVYVTNLTNYKYEVEIGSDFKIKNSTYASSNSGSISAGGSQTGGGASGESTLIDSLDFQNVNASSVRLDISVVTEDYAKIAGYYVFLNDKVVEVTKSKNISIYNLQKNTEYTLKVAAIDVDGNIKLTGEKKCRTADNDLNHSTGLLAFFPLQENFDADVASDIVGKLVKNSNLTPDFTNGALKINKSTSDFYAKTEKAIGVYNNKSIACQMYISSVDYWAMIFGHNAGGSTDCYGIWASKDYFKTYNGMYTWGNDTSNEGYIGKWVNVVYTMDLSGTAHLYLDGELFITQAGGRNSGDWDIAIGGGYDGYIKNFDIYDCELTQEQAASVFK